MFDEYGYDPDYGYEDEQWADIVGHPDYLISTFGRVWSIRKQIFLKPLFGSWGYEYVRLCKNGIDKDFLIHRLVANAFIPYRSDVDNANEVNHDDGDKRYNYVDNLEWVTSGENQRHAYRIGLKSPAVNAGRKKIPVKIVETNTVFASLSDCAKAIDGSHQKISHCLSGKRKRHKGYTFEYVE